MAASWNGVDGKSPIMANRNEQAMTEPAQPSTRYVPSTVAEGRADGSLPFLAICSCGWRGPDHDDEIPAFWDRWDRRRVRPSTIRLSWIIRLPPRPLIALAGDEESLTEESPSARVKLG